MVTLRERIKQQLVDGPKTTEELAKAMPDEKPVSIRAIATQNPDEFIRVTKGIIGRKNRDEYLQNFFKELTIEKVIKMLAENNN